MSKPKNTGRIREPRHRCCQCKRGIWPDRIAYAVSDRRTDLLACSVHCQRKWRQLQAKKLPTATKTRTEVGEDGQEVTILVLPARKSAKRATDKRDVHDRPHIHENRREERKKIGREEGDFRREAQQFVDRVVLLRREGKTAEANEIIDTLRLAKPHLAKIVTQDAKGRN